MGKLINGVWVDWIQKVKVLQKAVVKRNDGMFLVLKRPMNAKSRAGCWDLPGGSVEEEQILKWKEKSGKGDKDDILVKSIEEEIKQETGLEVFETKAIHSASGFDDSKGIFIVAIGYLSNLVDINSKISLSEEHSEFKWLLMDQLRDLDFGDDGGFIKSIIERL